MKKDDLNKLGKQLQFERLLTELSSRFVNLPSNELDDEIEYWLERICVFLDAERGGLHQFLDKEKKILTITHLYTMPGVKTPIVSPSEKVAPFLAKKVLEGEPIIAERLPWDLPPEAVMEKLYVAEEGLKSQIGIPLKAGGVVLGSVLFGVMSDYRSWSDELIKRLQLIGEVFANALLRKEIENTLAESEERFKNAFDNSSVAMVIFSPEGVFLEVNHAFCSFSGYSEDELLRMNSFDVTHPEDLDSLMKYIKQALSGDLQFFWSERRYIHRDGSVVWGYVSSSIVRDLDDDPLYFVAHIQDITEEKKKTELLRETNTALKVLLDHREEDKRQRDNEMYSTLHALIFPYIEKLNATPLDREQKSYLQILEANIEEITSSQPNKLVSLEGKLSHTELQVADLVKRGKTSQEIADLLRMSLPAVFFHRNNIRKKLGLRKTGTNLMNFLASSE